MNLRQRLLQPEDKMIFDERLINKAIEIYLADANERELNAGYGGHMHDGGAGYMRNNVDAYKAGLNKKVPDFLKSSYELAMKESDPEYKEFIRLSKKFK